MTIQPWMIPTAVTLLIWIVGVNMPGTPSRGDYDFSAGIESVFRLAGLIIATLIVWLIYFAMRP